MEDDNSLVNSIVLNQNVGSSGCGNGCGNGCGSGLTEIKTYLKELKDLIALIPNNGKY